MGVIVGIGYKKGSGKNTLAKLINTYLQRCCGKCVTKQVSFAEKVKDISYQLYSWANLKRGIHYESHYDEKEITLPLIGLSPRDIWIAVGNKMREIYPSTWVDYALKGIKANVILITDMGFHNEYQKIKESGGMCVKMIRNGLVLGTDARETELDSISNSHWDYVITNNGTISNLNIEAERIGNHILEKI